MHWPGDAGDRIPAYTRRVVQDPDRLIVEEKTISYAAPHDQALVGNKIHIFRLIDADMYGHMAIDDDNLVFERAGLIFAFNFHPTQSCSDYHIPATAGTYQMILDSDAKEFGGHGRLLPNQAHFTLPDSSLPTGQNVLSVYIPNRAAIVLQIKQPTSR